MVASYLKLFQKNEYEFKAIIKENHLNAAGITHGGFIAAFVDAGAGTAAHRSASGSPCVTVSLEVKIYFCSKIRTRISWKNKNTKKN